MPTQTPRRNHSTFHVPVVAYGKIKTRRDGYLMLLEALQKTPVPTLHEQANMDREMTRAMDRS